MNNIVFTTHATLDEQHAVNSLISLLLMQDHTDFQWDNFIIYNTHEHELSNEILVELIQELDVHGMVKNLMVFPYQDGMYPKTLTQDTINHFTILVQNGMNHAGKTLLLKSDYCVSSNFNWVFERQSNINTLWSLPIYNAKQKVDYTEYMAKLGQRGFLPTDDETYYRGGSNFPHTPGTLDDLFHERSPDPDIKDETDPRIKYVSHNIQNDYNLHVFSNDILYTCLQICQRVYNVNSTWGGAHDLFNVAFQHAGVERGTETRAYGIHMYHDIVSVNRSQDRTDPRKVIDGERY